jgi:hypothetical protein
VKSYAGTLVAALALVAACSSNKPTTTPQPDNNPATASSANPNTPPPASSDLGATGAADARSAVKAFLDAGRAQDLQALSAVWGSANGPLRNVITHDQLEKRELIVMCFLKHDSDVIGNPSAAAGSRMIFPATLTQGAITKSTTVTAIIGPSSRWYVETIDLPKIEAFCQKQQPPT